MAFLSYLALLRSWGNHMGISMKTGSAHVRLAILLLTISLLSFQSLLTFFFEVSLFSR